MIVLGLDTATSATSVALRLGDGTYSEVRDDPAAGEHPGHATRLLVMARELLAASGVPWSEVGRIAVGVGPGTFTGLRVGVATARGLAQSLSAELVAVSSLRALAGPALAGGPGAVAPDGVLAVIDARRGEAFAAVYGGPAEAPAELAVPEPHAPEQLASVLAAAHERARAHGGAGPQQAAGAQEGAPAPMPGRWLAVGDGAIRFRAQLEGAAEVPPDGSPLHLLTAASICELAFRAPAGEAMTEILPDYRRRPDAELALEAASAGRGSES